MEELVYEKIMQFLSELRCEDTERRSRVETDSCLLAKEKKKEKEKKIENIVNQLPVEEQKSIQSYLDIIDELTFEESQQAYFQGFVDCILTLVGAGVIKPRNSIEEMIKKFR